MKRVGIFLLACVYIISTTGTVLDIHYCMGHISGVNWDGVGARVAACGASQDPAGMPRCCRTESKVLKVVDVHQPATAYALSLVAPAVPVQPLCLLQARFFSVASGPVSMAHAPPPKRCSPLFIRHCAFLI